MRNSICVQRVNPFDAINSIEIAIGTHNCPNILMDAYAQMKPVICTEPGFTLF